ncbi:MAG: PhoH family protein [Eubacteriales bacterium]
MQNFCGQEIIRDRHNRPIYTKTQGQDNLVEAIKKNDIIFVDGPSGTGKTAIATWLGIAGMDSGNYEKLVLTRPVVTGGEELGFLPGSLDEKIAPYMQPLYDAISLIKGRRVKPEEQVKQMPTLTAKEKRAKRKDKNLDEIFSNNDFYSKVQVCPLAYIRGSTLQKSFIVCDEFQNTTVSQMKLMLTRLGRDSKMVICGDAQQCDLGDRADSGFVHALGLLRGVPRIGFVTLGVDDIVRHRLIKDIILKYERPGYKPSGDADEFSKVPSHTWERDAEGYDFSEDEEPDENADDRDYCPDCGGTGVDDSERVCSTCKGTGLVDVR